MIIQRKPYSDQKEFGRRDNHEYERGISEPHRLPRDHEYAGTGLRYCFSLGRGERFSDFAIDIEWNDVVKMLCFLAQKDFGPAKELMPILNNVLRRTLIKEEITENALIRARSNELSNPRANVVAQLLREIADQIENGDL